MKKLIQQILKFGVVGIIAFLVDFVVCIVLDRIFMLTAFPNAFSEILNNAFALNISASTVSRDVAGFFSFIVSVIVNYVLSMKYVFVRRNDISKKKEFVVFFILSFIGLILNTVLMTFFSELFEDKFTTLTSEHGSLTTAVIKCIVTGIVMVYNFISRKIFIEDHSKEKEEANSKEE